MAMKSDRGAGLALTSSLRVRVTLATGLAFVGLGAVVCLVLPRAYAEQVRESLHERTRILAYGVAHFVQREQVGAPEQHIQQIAAWLDREPDFDSAVLMSRSGEVVAQWPTTDRPWTPGAGAASTEMPGAVVATADVSGSGPVASVAVRTSTARMMSDLENVRWLFASIFVLACVAFWVLSRYLVKGIVDPVEEVRRAAMDLADGVPTVTVPASGSRELDELGEYLDALGQKRRQSTVMANPLLEYLQRQSPIPNAGNDPPQESTGG